MRVNKADVAVDIVDYVAGVKSWLRLISDCLDSAVVKYQQHIARWKAHRNLLLHQYHLFDKMWRPYYDIWLVSMDDLAMILQFADIDYDVAYLLTTKWLTFLD